MTTGNGYIPTSCLREILRELDDQLTDEELDIMIEEIDSDGSGTVDFDGKQPHLFIHKRQWDLLIQTRENSNDLGRQINFQLLERQFYACYVCALRVFDPENTPFLFSSHVSFNTEG